MTKKMKNALLLLFFAIASEVVNAQWTVTKGPYGGDIRCMTTFKNVIYAGTGSGVYISSNNGLSWKDISILRNGTVLSMVHNDTFVFASSSKGIFRTKDHGNNWETAKSFKIGEIPEKLFINENILYASIRDTLCKSLNNGSSWQPTGLRKKTNSIAFKDSFIFAATFEGLYRSADDGNSWIKVLNQTSGMEVVKKDSFIIFSTYNGVYRSLNNGDQWSYVNYGINTQVLRGLYVHNNAIWVASYKGPIRSIDNGNSWTLLGNGLNGPISNIEAYTHTDSFLLTGTTFGIHKFDSINATWIDRTNNLNSNNVSVLYTSDSTIYTSNLNGFSYSNDFGNKWKNIHPEGILLLKWGDSLFASAYNKFIFSTNGGQSWVDKPTNVINSGIREMYSLKGRIYISTGDGVYFSDNFGNQWTLMTNGLPKVPISAFNINDKIFAAGTNEGIYISIDYGQTWVKKSDLFNTSQERILDITINDTLLFVFNYNKIYMSKDYGNSWLNISHNFDSVIYKDIISIGKFLIVGTSGNGVYLTNINNGIWRQINEGFPENLFIINLQRSDEYLFAGTQGKGLWMRKLDEFITYISSFEANDFFSIYPNPSQGQISIRTNSTLLGAKFTIYNLLGETMLTGNISEEKTFVSIDSLKEGIYIINVGGICEKIVLTR